MENNEEFSTSGVEALIPSKICLGFLESSREMKTLYSPNIWTGCLESKGSSKLRYQVQRCGSLGGHIQRGRRCLASGGDSMSTMGSAEDFNRLSAGMKAPTEIWEGILVTYSPSNTGEFHPDEIEYRFVPDAYREWGLPVRDWKVRTNVALEDDKIVFKTARMLPSAGCEADDTVAFTETSYSIWNSSEKESNYLCAECNPEDPNCTVEFVFTESQSARMRLRVQFDGAGGPIPGVIRKVDQILESVDEIVNEFSNKDKLSLSEKEIVNVMKFNATETKNNECFALPLGVCVGRTTTDTGVSILYSIWSTALGSRFIGKVEYDGAILSTQLHREGI